MKNSFNIYKQKTQSALKKVAYSNSVRSSARKIIAASKHQPFIGQSIEKAGIDHKIRRLASEQLPEGKYFAKLTIKDWEKYRDKKFRLFQGNKVVYGNQIEPPARGFPLEYRNIVVTSTNLDNFRLSIDAPFTLAISRGAYTTQQQQDYDNQYGVEQHGDIFYSLRGNKVNPSKILITFPGFGPSTTRIPYAVSYLKALTDQDLRNTLMVCFQDRYMVSGTYMMTDSAGRPLYSRVKSAIDNLLGKYGISDKDMMLFGASKGGSIAIQYAKEYPKAHLVLAVPQMRLPYYMNKPFFRYNLYEVPAIHNLDQPEDLLRKYFDEGRKIDYFYTNSDELSNHSLIEIARGVQGLTKYRIQGKHGEVARTALPSILSLMRKFIGLGEEKKISADTLRTYQDENFLYAQARIQPGLDQELNTNWYLEGNLDGTVFRSLLTSHSYDFIKYSDRSQRIIPAYDPVETMNRIVGLQENGREYFGEFEDSLQRSDNHKNSIISDFSPILPDTNGLIHVYSVINGATFSRFSYQSQLINESGTTVEVHFVNDMAVASKIKPAAQQTYPTSHLIIVESLDEMVFAQLFALRSVMSLRGERLRIVLHQTGLTADIIKALVKTDWIQVQVVVVRGVMDLNPARRPYSNWIRKRRLNILASAHKEMSLAKTGETMESQAREIRLPLTSQELRRRIETARENAAVSGKSALRRRAHINSFDDVQDNVQIISEVEVNHGGIATVPKETKPKGQIGSTVSSTSKNSHVEKNNDDKESDASDKSQSEQVASIKKNNNSLKGVIQKKNKRKKR